MKISNIFKEVINEDFKSQTRRYIAQGIEPEIVGSYIEKFKHIRDKKYKDMFDKTLDISVPPEKRNDIDAYTDFHDLETLVDYVGGRRPINTTISQGNSNEQIEVSGEAIYKDANFELFYADNPRACIKYKGKFPYSWCVARSDSSNMFYTYRFKPYEPAFYFVKDIKAADKEFGIWNMTKNVFKGQFNNPYHFFVIQVPKNAKMDDVETQEYIVTSANNDGDKQMSWNEILKLNPNIAPLHKFLEPKPFTPEERQKHERFKNGIDDVEFAKLSYENKRDYLDIYPTIARGLTDHQLVQLPEDLLNLYVSFGIGLSDVQFAYIKKMPAILKRYTQISKKKLDEYMKRDGYERRQLKMAFTELIVLSDQDINTYLKSLTNKDVNTFIHTFGEDKFEFLEKHVPDKFTPENKALRTLIVNANNGDEEAITKLRTMVPEGVELRFDDDYIKIDTGNYGNYINKKLDREKESFYGMLDYSTISSSYGNYYFDGDNEGLDNTIESYIEKVMGENEVSNLLKSVGLESNVETIKDLLESYKQLDDVGNIISTEFSNAQENAEDKAFIEIRDSIKNIIYLDDDIVEVKIMPFILFLTNNAFFNTDRQVFIDNVIHLLENILEDFDVPDNADSIYEEVRNDGYQEMVVDDEELKRDMINYIEKAVELFNEDTGESTGENPEGQKVVKLKSQIINSLNDTLKGLGQDPFAKTIENDIVRIDFDRQKFHLDGKIYIRLTDKKTSKSHDGYVRIKDIPSYFTNYKLFEQTSRIKSLIRY